jgi:Cu(I)/Ag(I) efflux system membrane fusion protein/cobalt-zinc-cadmium efflux system membrane fusion protein
VSFFMPAMPAMGMGAMEAKATLRSSGGGLYQGALQLDSAGLWQVTVTASQAGRILAQLHTTERATP